MPLALVTPFTHRFLGPMWRVMLKPGFVWEMTPWEARSLRRSLCALCADHSLLERIYIRPTASDVEFRANVSEEGIAIELNGDQVMLDWTEAAALAAMLPETE